MSEILKFSLAIKDKIHWKSFSMKMKDSKNIWAFTFKYDSLLKKYGPWGSFLFYFSFTSVRGGNTIGSAKHSVTLNEFYV